MEEFPYYLSIGMTESQYWDKDCALVRAYRKADELKQERKNSELWLLGGYIYETITRLAPIPVAFAKNGVKSQPYLEEPLVFTEKQSKHSEEQRQKQKYNKGKLFMEQFMVNHNQKYERK